MRVEVLRVEEGGEGGGKKLGVMIGWLRSLVGSKNVH